MQVSKLPYAVCFLISLNKGVWIVAKTVRLVYARTVFGIDRDQKVPIQLLHVCCVVTGNKCLITCYTFFNGARACVYYLSKVATTRLRRTSGVVYFGFRTGGRQSNQSSGGKDKRIERRSELIRHF
jgi:hypothetical protein